MHIKGLAETTLVDYPGKVACTVFFGSCNFRCPFCHNPDLVNNTGEDLDPQSVYSFLKKNKKWLDAVCITGGEPTLDKDLKEFILKAKEFGYLVKLDTNGTRPDVISDLLPHLDYIAMDIKTSPLRYEKATLVPVDVATLEKSRDMIMRANDYEFRTTVVPGIVDEQDMIDISEFLKGAKKYSIQQYTNKNTLDPNFANTKPYPKEILKNFRKISEKKITYVMMNNI
ncbi:anaerobic ribonucleoside-triphosphate reductase activating protein [Candidatus Woesearchaeota archaeon]|nr:anaerobic ribonucleoside-triphosphate reductase activating protein [Candidatus Woesearchaeota archaeon]